MANTFTQIYLQLIFAVKYKRALIDRSWKEELNKYTTGIIRNNNHRLLNINGMEDHLHILVGFKPHQSLSDLIRDIKANSSKWINERNFTKGNFAWQGGYGAFSYSHSHLNKVKNFIINQEEYHKKISFIEEYRKLLKAFNVEFDERYILKEPE